MGFDIPLNTGGTSFAFFEQFDEGGPTFYMFNPLAVLALLYSPDSDAFQFWCQSCGSQWLSQLINSNSISAAFPPSYVCMTAAEIASLGLCEVGLQWLYSSW